MSVWPQRKVRERTRDLEQTLEEVKKLKQQQDGDYFLTSLLLQPLWVNGAKSARVKTEFFQKQKKEFQFKKWRREMGGRARSI